MKKILFPNPNQKILGIKTYYRSPSIEDFIEQKDLVKFDELGYSVLIENTYGLNCQIFPLVEFPQLFNGSILSDLKVEENVETGLAEILVGNLQKFPYTDERGLDILFLKSLFEKGKIQFDLLNRKICSQFCMVYSPNFSPLPILYFFETSGARREGDKKLLEKLKDLFEENKNGLRPVWEN